MLRALLAPLGWIPLPWLHALGGALGILAYRLSTRLASRIRENVGQAGVASGDHETFCRHAAEEIGKSVAELPFVWVRSSPDFLSHVTPDPVWTEVLSTKRAAGGRMILATPHLGAFEVAGRFLAEHFPIAIMYRAPKLRWLEPLLLVGRRHGHARLVTADRRGVRELLKSLRAGGAVGILPDQTPGGGEGVWAPFFGRPAYTVSLLGRLQQATGAPIAVGFAERLPAGKGFRIRGKLLADPLPEDPVEAATAVNAAIEDLVRMCPVQYLWAYNRYKVPAGAPPPQAAQARASAPSGGQGAGSESRATR